MIRTYKNTNTNNKSIELLSDSRPPDNYYAGASTDADPRHWCAMLNGIALYDKLNPTLIQSYDFSRNPLCFQF